MVSLMLSFAAGVMVAVVCLDLLTEAMAAGAVRAIGGVLAGYGASELLSRCLDRPEGGRLLVAGAVTAAAIAAHNLPEGMAIGAAFAGGTGGEGWLLTAVIAAHNIPEGMAVAAPLAAGGDVPGGWRQHWPRRQGSPRWRGPRWGIRSREHGPGAAGDDAGSGFRSDAVCGVRRAAAREQPAVGLPLSGAGGGRRGPDGHGDRRGIGRGTSA